MYKYDTLYVSRSAAFVLIWYTVSSALSRSTFFTCHLSVFADVGSGAVGLPALTSVYVSFASIRISTYVWLTNETSLGLSSFTTYTGAVSFVSSSITILVAVGLYVFEPYVTTTPPFLIVASILFLVRCSTKCSTTFSLVTTSIGI